jgi:hypothetical protein
MDPSCCGKLWRRLNLGLCLCSAGLHQDDRIALFRRLTTVGLPGSSPSVGECNGDFAKTEKQGHILRNNLAAS